MSTTESPVSAATQTAFALPELRRFRQRVLERRVEDTSCGWEDILIPQGLAIGARELGDTDMQAWVESWFEYHAEIPVAAERNVYGHGGHPRGFVLNDYCGNWGAPLALAPLQEIAPRDAYLEMIHKACASIFNDGIKLKDAKADGVLAHGGFAPNTVWVDTLYYSSAALADAWRVTGEKRYADEATRQCLLHARVLRDARTGLFYHDYHPDSGQRTPAFWARGNGWIVLGLADTLRNVPRETQGYEEILEIFRTLIEGLMRWQHPSGLWRIVPEVEHAYLETSGSTMIATGLAIGVCEGWLEISVRDNVRQILHELTTWIGGSGALMGAQRPAGRGGWETHKKSTIGECTYATGLLLRLVAETYRMEQAPLKELI